MQTWEGKEGGWTWRRKFARRTSQTDRSRLSVCCAACMGREKEEEEESTSFFEQSKGDKKVGSSPFLPSFEFVGTDPKRKEKAINSSDDALYGIYGAKRAERER